MCIFDIKIIARSFYPHSQTHNCLVLSAHQRVLQQQLDQFLLFDSPAAREAINSKQLFPEALKTELTLWEVHFSPAWVSLVSASMFGL